MRFVAPVLHIAVGPPLQSRVSSRGVDRLLGTIGRRRPPPQYLGTWLCEDNPTILTEQASGRHNPFVRLYNSER
jgi:hypothetical protein